MKKERISFDTFQPYSLLIQDFLSRSENLSDFLPNPNTIEGFKSIIDERKQFQPNRSLLVNDLIDQYKDAKLEVEGNPVGSNIQSLNDSKTFTVTTGHQLNIFTGPLFFVIKILHVIKLSQYLNENIDHCHFVPVFWMATEDHDFAEINHTHLFNKTLKWDDEQGGMVGNYSLATFQSELAKMVELLGDSDLATHLSKIFKDSYASTNNLSQATRIMVHRLFGERGLVILDGSRKNLKSEFSLKMKEELKNNTINENVSSSIENLSDKYKIQVNPRDVNLFYLKDNSRLRIEQDNNGFNCVGGGKDWKSDEIYKEIDEYPERFSPNVLLRPVYQETILPNVAYVGGAGEMAYWLELKSTFLAFKVPYPNLVMRNSFIWLDKIKCKKLKKIGLSYHDFFKPEKELVAFLSEGDDFFEKSIEKEVEEISNSFGNIAVMVKDVDASLEPSVMSEKRKVEKQIENLKHKIFKANKKKHEEALNSFWIIYEKVFPNNVLHERYDNFVPYYLTHGEDFFSTIYDAIQPFNAEVGIISEQDDT